MGTEREAPFNERDRHRGGCQRGADVRPRVPVALVQVLPGPFLVDQPVEGAGDVGRDRACALAGGLKDDPSGRMRDEERRQRAVAVRQQLGDLVGHIQQLGSPLGLDRQLRHGRIVTGGHRRA